MRARLAWLLLLPGLLVLAAGAALMIVLGPDSRITTGPHDVDTSASAVVTAPGLITHRGVQVDVMAEVPLNKPVFVGLGHTVDVRDYLADSARLEVTEFSLPWDPTVREIEGRPAVPTAPTALDWWLAGGAGLGGATVSATLPDDSVSLAIVSMGDSNLSGLRVTFAYGIKGGFGLGLGLALAGAGLLALGWLLRGQLRPAWGPTGHDLVGDEVEEIVYVLVEEDGTEREITPAEAARIEAEQEGAPPPAPPARPEAPTPPEPPAPPEPVAERVVYVLVDEDGTEHEIDAAELDQYEVVDDDPEQERP